MLEIKLLWYSIFIYILSISSFTLSCPPGYIGNGNNCTICPYGHYCPTSSQAILCPKGTVNSWTFMDPSDRVKCKECPLGYYNDKEGGIYNLYQSDCIRCPDGYYCPKIDESPIICPKGTVNANGYYVSERVKCVECWLGSYNDKEGGIRNDSYSDCKTCPPGHYCPRIDQPPILCPVNTINSYGGSDRIKCDKCPVGWYNDKEGGIQNNWSGSSPGDCKYCNIC